MRITARLIGSLIIVATAVVLTSAGIQARQERRRLERELQQRAGVLAEGLQESVESLLETGNLDGLQRLTERFGGRERLSGTAVYSVEGQLLAATPSLPAAFREWPAQAQAAVEDGRQADVFLTSSGRRWHLQATPVRRGGEVVGVLTLVHDARSIDRACAKLWRENVVRLLFHVLLISLTTLVIVRWSLLRPLSRTVEWVRRIRTGEAESPAPLPKEDLFAPLAREVAHMAESLTSARAAAEEEARLRHAGESRWTPERLKEHVRSVLEGRPLVVVANREPYMHVRDGRQIRWLVPASGLVTALEPVLRACGGTWVGHGAGEADRETADARGRLRVPPDAPQYVLKRVWLTKEEEEGYYYRFANEGLWPLCHIAHTRPIFHVEDWQQYQRVNGKFAEAVLEELEGADSPFVLIQDYHFALLPQLIKERRPDARIALFWHIPWPNPEAFGICPWARELLYGMASADLLGFHIQFHCNNFLETVDRLVECRIDREQFAVHRGDHMTWVKPFPISIASDQPPVAQDAAASEALKEALLRTLGVQAEYLGVGVDRVDYTKGIGERFRAVERLLEKHPEYRGRFTFVELGAPSRTLIKRYHDLGEELDAEAARINQRFQTRTWKPIVFLHKHHSHADIQPFYQAAHVCLVTSLHDGMNLVAKEYVAARTDERGVLILSRFAGASRELRDALLVNPYDIDQMAEALHTAITMEPEEQRARVTRMRQTLQERNVYRWAADLVGELGRVVAAAPKA